MCKISVIIPVYNVEDYLTECLDSVINQTFDDIEIICVDDGSTDNSSEILKKYEENDKRLRIITQENKGLSGARNTGLENANGKYIYFLDSDDYIEQNTLKEIYEISEKNNLDMLFFKIICFYDETKENFTTPYFEMNFLNDFKNKIFNYKEIGADVYNLAVTMQSSFFNAELISNLRFPEGLIFEDNPFFIEAILKSNRAYFYDKYLCNKRERKGSIITTGAKFSDIVEIRNQIIELAKKYKNYEGYETFLYRKKYSLVKSRFLETSDEYKPEFFNTIKQDCENKKEKYESDENFLKLEDDLKNVFYAALSSKNCQEFKNKIF